MFDVNHSLKVNGRNAEHVLYSIARPLVSQHAVLEIVGIGGTSCKKVFVCVYHRKKWAGKDDGSILVWAAVLGNKPSSCGIQTDRVALVTCWEKPRRVRRVYLCLVSSSPDSAVHLSI